MKLLVHLVQEFDILNQLDTSIMEKLDTREPGASQNKTLQEGIN
jgi:hypothetical protein